MNKVLVDGPVGPKTAIAIQPPTIGRIVHYTASSGPRAVTHAAMILALGPAAGRVHLKIEAGDYGVPGRSSGPDLREPMLSSSQRVAGIPFSPQPRAGHWSYPPRV